MEESGLTQETVTGLGVAMITVGITIEDEGWQDGRSWSKTILLPMMR